MGVDRSKANIHKYNDAQRYTTYTIILLYNLEPSQNTSRLVQSTSPRYNPDNNIYANNARANETVGLIRCGENSSFQDYIHFRSTNQMTFDRSCL